MNTRRSQPPECEECPEWIFTFADLVMLMMGFFVILWVLKPSVDAAQSAPNSAERERWEQTVAAVRDSFGYQPSPDSTDPIDRILLEGLRKSAGDKSRGETLEPRTSVEGTDQHASMIRTSPTAGTGGKVIFAAGSSQISAGQEILIDELARLIRGYRLVVLVKGHSTRDEVNPEDSSDAALVLSVDRARAVRDALVSRGVAADTLRVVGCSYYEPIHRWSTGKHDALTNRRAEIEVTSQLVSELQPAK